MVVLTYTYNIISATLICNAVENDKEKEEESSNTYFAIGPEQIINLVGHIWEAGKIDAHASGIVLLSSRKKSALPNKPQ